MTNVQRTDGSGHVLCNQTFGPMIKGVHSPLPKIHEDAARNRYVRPILKYSTQQSPKEVAEDRFRNVLA